MDTTIPGAPAFQELGAERAPTAAEETLLHKLASAHGPSLVAQTRNTRVVGECSCGCASIQLTTTAERLQSTPGAGEPEKTAPEHFAVQTTGVSPEKHLIEITLHVLEGTIHELEVYDTTTGEGGTVDLEHLEKLSPPEIL